MKSVLTTVSLIVTFITGALAADALHARAQAQGEQVLPALLAEVRGLRAAMELMASAGPRIQLAFGRLQMQEQRVSALLRRLDPVREKLAEAQRQQADHERQYQGYLGMAARAADGRERDQLEGASRVEQRKANDSTAEVQRLTAEEAAVSAELALEQARWTDINQRLTNWNGHSPSVE